MSKWFVAALPWEDGRPRFTPAQYRDAYVVGLEGNNRFFTVTPKDPFAKKKRYGLIGQYFGRLDEGELGFSGRPGVIVCTGTPATFTWLKDVTSGNSSYDFKTLEAVWQNTAARDWLIAAGMDTVAGEFAPNPAINVRPLLGVVFAGASRDIFAPEDSP